MASKVLKELEELRHMLAQPTPSLMASPAGIAFSSSPSRMSPPMSSPHTLFGQAEVPSYAATISAAATAAGSSPHRAGPWSIGAFQGQHVVTGSRVPERLGRALEVAEQEMDAAMARQTDILTSQLHARGIDLLEAQQEARAARAEVAALRSQLAAARQAAAAAAAAAQARLAAKDIELSSAHAELIALKAEVDDLRQRLADGHAALDRADAALSAHTQDLSRRLHATAADAESAAAAANWERQHKESALSQLAECQAQLAGAQEELRSKVEELQQVRQEVAALEDTRLRLEAVVQRHAAAAESLKEAKDIEIAELSRRLCAERGVRKACEAWLHSELNSREEMETLLQAVHQIAGNSQPAGAEAGAQHSRAPASSSPCGSSSNQAGTTSEEVQVLLEQLCRQQMHQVPTASQPAQPDVQQQQQASGWAAASATSKHQLQSGAAAVARKAAAGMDRLLAGELQAEQARKEFVQLKAALSHDRRRLKSDLESAKQLLETRMRACGSHSKITDRSVASNKH